MIKKLMLLAVAACSLVAFAAPAAQADQLYEEGVGPLNIGAEITLTSTNLETVTPLGTLECEEVTIHGEVTQNGPTTITGKELLTEVIGCNKEITDPTAGTVSLSKGTGSTTGTKFIAEGFCTYTGSITFSYTTNSDVVTVTGKEQLTGSPSFPCGKGTMSGSFTIETGDEAETPVYIS
jgi:hypothetical protein